MGEPSNDELTPEQIARRRDEALRRALATPPQPKQGKVKEPKAGQYAPAAKPKRRGRSGAVS